MAQAQTQAQAQAQAQSPSWSEDAASSFARMTLVLRDSAQHATKELAKHDDLVASSISAVSVALSGLRERSSSMFWFGLASGALLSVVVARCKVKRLHTGTDGNNHADDTMKGTSNSATVNAPTCTEQEIVAASGRLETAFRGLLTSCMVSVGDSLGIYQELYRIGKPVTPQQLADTLGLDARFLREWLSQQAGAGILDYKGGGEDQSRAVQKAKFSLRPEYARTLLEPTHSYGTHSMIGLFQWAPALAERIGKDLSTALESGKGQEYDGSCACSIAQAIRTLHLPFANHVLCDSLLQNYPQVNGDMSLPIAERLKMGGLVVAEVGGGAGLALCNMASRFPKSTFHGFELSKVAVRMTRDNIKRHKVEKNCEMFDVSTHPMKAGFYDFALMYDVVHDCTDPSFVLRQVCSALKPRGTVLVVDIEADQDLGVNISQSGAETRYGLSCAVCLHSGSSDKGTRGGDASLGIYGLSVETFGELVIAAGFSKFEHFSPAELPGNRCFVCQK